MAKPVPEQPHQSQAHRFSSDIMRLLDSDRAAKSLWWINEKTFAIDSKTFQEDVLDPYFRGTKYASFLRSMHKMGFTRLSRRFDLPRGVVAFSSPHFVRGKPELLERIKMDNAGKKAAKKKAEVGLKTLPSVAFPVPLKTDVNRAEHKKNLVLSPRTASFPQESPLAEDQNEKLLLLGLTQQPSVQARTEYGYSVSTGVLSPSAELLKTLLAGIQQQHQQEQQQVRTNLLTYQQKLVDQSALLRAQQQAEIEQQKLDKLKTQLLARTLLLNSFSTPLNPANGSYL